MYLCSRGHEEICFESRNCPLCEVISEKKEVEEELRTVKEECELLRMSAED